MNKIANLRTFRKRKIREESAEKAEKNRALFGTSTKLKKSAKIENETDIRKLDGKRLSPDDKA